MNTKLTPQEIEKMKNMLKGLKAFELSDRARQTFISRLESIPKPEKAFVFSGLRERVYIGTQEVYSRLQDAFARPVPALARVAVLLALFAFTYSFVFSPQAPLLHSIDGTVKIFNAARNEWMLARNNQRIQKGDIVKTFEDGSVDIDLNDIYSMRLKTDSEIKVAQLGLRISNRAVRFDVAKGKILAYYNKNRGKKGFELKTDEVVASVVGTDFMLTALPILHKTNIGVLDGIVRVTGTNIPEGLRPEKAAVLVESRHKTEVTAGELPPPPQRMMEDEWLELEELYSIGKKPQVAILISTEPTRSRELLSIAPLYISDKEPSVLPAKIKKIAKDFNRAVEEKSKALHMDIVKDFETLIEKYPNPNYDVQFSLFLGAYYEHLGDHKKAIETFQKVLDRHAGSNLASIAQCAIGIIYEEKLNNPKKAEEAYRAVISRYPESPEVEEALMGIKRLRR